MRAVAPQMMYVNIFGAVNLDDSLTWMFSGLCDVKSALLERRKKENPPMHNSLWNAKANILNASDRSQQVKVAGAWGKWR